MLGTCYEASQGVKIRVLRVHPTLSQNGAKLGLVAAVASAPSSGGTPQYAEWTSKVRFFLMAFKDTWWWLHLGLLYVRGVLLHCLQVKVTPRALGISVARKKGLLVDETMDRFILQLRDRATKLKIVTCLLSI